MTFKTDLVIAKEAHKKPINEIASQLDIHGDQLSEEMLKRNILGRPSLRHTDISGLRISTAFFNTENELDFVLNAVSDISNKI